MTLFSIAFLLACVLVANSSSKQLNTLVIVSDDFSKYTYSRFFKSLKRRGHKLQIKPCTDKSIQLLQYGESLYDNLIILSPSATKLGDLSYKDILLYMDHINTNVFIAVDQSSSDFIRKIADRCGIKIHSKDSIIRDHMSYDAQRALLNHDVIITDHWSSFVVKDEHKRLQPVLYSGIGMSFKARSHLTLSLLTGNAHTHSISTENENAPPEKRIISSGEELSLVSALQMRNNGRVTFVGSLKMLSDEYLLATICNSMADECTDEHYGNARFIEYISEWTFGERAILRAVNVQHFKIDDEYHTLNPSRYRTSDMVKFELDLEEYQLNCDCWLPFIADDVQFQFIRLDAFVRQMMDHGSNGHYSIQFKLPDVMGVYKFTVDYNRYAYSHLIVEELVSIRPFRHDEYDRFLSVAYPYYTTSFVMICGFIVFSFVFLFGKKSKKKRLWTN